MPDAGGLFCLPVYRIVETREGPVKKLLLGLVVAFAAFYLFTQPVGAAEAIKGAAAAVGVAFESIIEFITALIRG